MLAAAFGHAEVCVKLGALGVDPNLKRVSVVEQTCIIIA